MAGIEFDSVKTHVHSLTTILLVGVHTSIYAVHSPHSHIIPYVLLTSSYGLGAVWMSTQQFLPNPSTQLVCTMKRNGVVGGILWWLWLVYGSIWEREHRIGALSGWLVEGTYAALGLWSTVRHMQRRSVWYALVLGSYAALFFCPTVGNTAQYIEPLDALVRVCGFVVLFYTNLYVQLATRREVESAYLFATTMWMLMVNKWLVVLLAPHLALQLRMLSDLYSKRPEAESDESDEALLDMEAAASLSPTPQCPATDEAKATKGMGPRLPIEARSVLEHRAMPTQSTGQMRRNFFNKPRGTKSDGLMLKRASESIPVL